MSTVGTPIVLYTRPGQNQNTEMMLVVMTDTHVVLGVLNTCRVFKVFIFLTNLPTRDYPAWRDTWNSINVMHTCTNRHYQLKWKHLSDDRQGWHGKTWMSRPPREMELADSSLLRRQRTSVSTPTLERLIFPNFVTSTHSKRSPWTRNTPNFSQLWILQWRLIFLCFLS